MSYRAGRDGDPREDAELGAGSWELRRGLRPEEIPQSEGDTNPEKATNSERNTEPGRETNKWAAKPHILNSMTSFLQDWAQAPVVI